MATEITIDETPTNGANPYIDSLVSKGAWIDDDGGTVTIKVKIASGLTGISGVAGDAWLDPELAAVRLALAAWAGVADINFEEVISTDDADIRLWRVTDDEFAQLPGGQSGGLGLAESPWDPSDKVNVYFNSDGDGWITPNGLMPGGYAYATLIHEIGHALGLAHPHAGDPSLPEGTAFPGVNSPISRGTNDLNQGVFTIMTYNDGWQTQYPDYKALEGNFGFGWQAAPMALDIAAIQTIYKGSLKVNAPENTSYALPSANGPGTGWRSIWDTGGNDTISAIDAKDSVQISLQAAPLVGRTAGGTVSYAEGVIGGFTIANGVTIEDAIGGNFSDSISGNQVANILVGGNGDDVLHGGAQGDQLIGGDGSDTASYLFDRAVSLSLDGSIAATGTAAGDVLNSIEWIIGSGTGSDVLAGDAGENVIQGNGGGDKLFGRDGDDTLDGGAGDDTLSGEAGSNTLIGGADFDLVSYFNDGALALALDGMFAASGSAADDEISEVEGISGSNIGNDKLAGDARANRLYGNGGNDKLYGNSGEDYIRGGIGEDYISGGSDNDLIRGDDGADDLFGREGADILIGGAGRDILTGNTGADQYRYESRSDLGDKITSFSSSDTFAFKASAFKNLKKGFLNSEHLILRNDSRAAEKDDYFIFEKDTDRLWFDSDGSGSKKPILVADMDLSVNLTVKDILII
jgi:serralysin